MLILAVSNRKLKLQYMLILAWGWQVIQAREAYLPEDDPDVLDVKRQVASVYVRDDRHLEAIPILKRLIKVISSCLGPDDRLLLSAQHYLGLAYNYAGEYDKAIAVLGPLAVVHANVLDRKHKDRLITMNVLACAHQDYGRSEKAIDIWEEIASLESDLPANMEQFWSNGCLSEEKMDPPSSCFKN
ncbi:hypothetical protein KCU71_g6557, partial [Aureobasidium melanogenum]